MNNIYDLLIIGSGGAGLSAAISAKEKLQKVAIVSKSYPTHSQTVQAQGGINAVLDFEIDSYANHIEDTFKSSKGLSNINNIKTMCENATDCINWLFEMGVPFSMNSDKKIAQRKFGGTKHQRTCYSSDYTGLKILHTLHERAIKDEIEFINEHLLLNIIVEDEEAKGVTALDIVNGEVVELLAKKVIIATGGYGNIYNGFTTNSHATTGDGVAAALRAGCRLSNMEFVQFHPTAMKHGNILISESARGEGGYLVNDKGERFIEELKPRDEVARAIYTQIENKNEVYLDLRHLGLEKINKTMPQERVLALQFSGVKIEDELLPIRPAMHYCMGGIKTDGKGRTNIKNLYAIGESAENGVHGANRLGGNSLLEIIVFGRIAGVDASIDSKEINIKSNTKQYISDKNFIDAVYNFSNQIDFYEKKEFMGKIFFKNIGLFRTDMNMKAVLSQVRQWQKEFNFMGIGDKSRYYNKNLVEFIEFGNMLELSEVVAVSAISRCESRGAHYRVDYSDTNKSFEKNTIAYKVDGVLAVDFEDVK